MHIAMINTLSTPAITELKEVLSGKKRYRDALKRVNIITRGRISRFICVLNMIM